MGRRDADEFAAFVAGSQQALRRTAYLLCGDWHLASDHVQEAYVKVYRRWPRLTRNGAELAYARAAVASVVIDSKRKRSSTEVVADELERRAPAESDHASGHADRDLLLRCLQRLPDRQRACVVLRHYEDLTVAEVARALGCSEGTVKSQTARGLTTLQSHYLAATDDELVVSGKDLS